MAKSPIEVLITGAEVLFEVGLGVRDEITVDIVGFACGGVCVETVDEDGIQAERQIIAAVMTNRIIFFKLKFPFRVVSYMKVIVSDLLKKFSRLVSNTSSCWV